MRQNRQSTKMYVVHHNTLSDSFRIRIVWFQPKQDSNQIQISFHKSRIGSDSKKTLSDHLWCALPSIAVFASWAILFLPEISWRCFSRLLLVAPRAPITIGTTLPWCSTFSAFSVNIYYYYYIFFLLSSHLLLFPIAWCFNLSWLFGLVLSQLVSFTACWCLL